MRVNVYDEELVYDAEVVTSRSPIRSTYYGVRIPLASSHVTYGPPDDDDRSAVTFWTHDLQRAEQACELVNEAVDLLYMAG